MLDGGELAIEWRESDDHMLMTGPGDARSYRRGRSRGAAMSAPKSSLSAAGSTPMNPKRSARAPPRRGLRDAVIVNTCAVTAEAVRQSRQAIRKLRREKPARADHRHRLRGADRTRDLCRDARSRSGARQSREARGRKLCRFRLGDVERVRVNDIMACKETASQFVDSFEGRARAFLQVQNGCDHRCTFCIIPYGRGNSRSVADGRGGRRSAPAGRKGLRRDRADGRGSDRLWRRPAGRAARSGSWCARS